MDFVYYRFYLVQMTKADVFNHWVSYSVDMGDISPCDMDTLLLLPACTS